MTRLSQDAEFVHNRVIIPIASSAAVQRGRTRGLGRSASLTGIPWRTARITGDIHAVEASLHLGGLPQQVTACKSNV